MSERDVEGLRLVGFSGTKASGRAALYRHRTRPSFLPGITAPRIRGSWQGHHSLSARAAVPPPMWYSLWLYCPSMRIRSIRVGLREAVNLFDILRYYCSLLPSVKMKPTRGLHEACPNGQDVLRRRQGSGSTDQPRKISGHG